MVEIVEADAVTEPDDETQPPDGYVPTDNLESAAALAAAAKPAHPQPLTTSQEAMDGSQLHFAEGQCVHSLRGGDSLGRHCLPHPAYEHDPRRLPRPDLAKAVGQTGNVRAEPWPAQGYSYQPPASATLRKKPVATEEVPAEMGYRTVGPPTEPSWSRGSRGEGPDALDDNFPSPSANRRGSALPGQTPAPREPGAASAHG